MIIQLNMHLICDLILSLQQKIILFANFLGQFGPTYELLWPTDHS